jgi:hypothetical protein
MADFETRWTNGGADGFSDGGYFEDYFRDDGWAAAKAAPTTEAALLILRATYLGPDEHGVGVEWAASSLGPWMGA